MASSISEAYVAVSPKSKVPALDRDDGSVLTEYGAIATWLARTNPEAKLLPSDPDAEVRAMEAMDYAVATMHMQGFARFARPANFAPDEASKEAVQARGREIYGQGLRHPGAQARRQALGCGRCVLDRRHGRVLRVELGAAGGRRVAARARRPFQPHEGAPSRAADDAAEGLSL